MCRISALFDKGQGVCATRLLCVRKERDGGCVTSLLCLMEETLYVSHVCFV